MQFLSTPSARRATGYRGPKTEDEYISIHALREEGDDDRGVEIPSHTEFLSTPSARRATQLDDTKTATEVISIHALREEGDRLRLALPLRFLDFYPRPPRGGRHIGCHVSTLCE